MLVFIWLGRGCLFVLNYRYKIDLNCQAGVLWRGSGRVTVQFLAPFSIDFLWQFASAVIFLGLSAIKNQVFPLPYLKTELKLTGAHLLVCPQSLQDFFFLSLLIIMHTSEPYRSWGNKTTLASVAFSSFHRITESLKLEKTPKIVDSKL